MKYQFTGDLILLSDAALALAIGCEIKWLYNSARRLEKPIRRSMNDATWWRMVHHLAVGLGVPLASASNAADTLLASGLQPSKVRLRATNDESVSVVVDLARFHDGASLALAAAQFQAVPRTRGRPRTRVTSGSTVQFSAVEMARVVQLRSLPSAVRLQTALEQVPGSVRLAVAGAAHVVRLLADSGIPFVLIGGVATVFHGAPWPPASLDLCADMSPRHALGLTRLLNGLGALPRGAASRDGFVIEPSLFRSCSVLALTVGSVELNIFPDLSDVGEYQQVEATSVRTVLGESEVNVLSLETLVQVNLPVGHGNESERARQMELLRTIRGMDPGTR